MKWLLCLLALAIASSALALDPLPRGLIQPDWRLVDSKEYQSRITKGQLWMKLGMTDTALLLPKDFILETASETKFRQGDLNQRLQILTDAAIKGILGTRTGQAVAMQYSQGYAHMLEFGLRLSPAETLRYQELYRKLFARLGQTPQPATEEYAGSATFVFTRQKMPYQSWTDFLLTTYIVVNPEDLSPTCVDCDEKFYRIFAHELAQVADAKSVPWPFEDFKDRLQSQNTCAAYTAAHHPLVRMAFGAWRAFQVEDQILREMGVATANPTPSSMSGSCSNNLKKYLQLSIPFQKVLMDEQAGQKLNSFSDDCALTYSDYSLQEILRILDTEQIKTGPTTPISLCQYLAQPKFAPPPSSGRRFQSPGPRPNVGNGTGTGASKESALSNPSLDRLDAESRKISLDVLKKAQSDKDNALSLESRDRLRLQIREMESKPSLEKQKSLQDQKPSYLRGG